jgi:hypothetical protein
VTPLPRGQEPGGLAAAGVGRLKLHIAGLITQGQEAVGGAKVARLTLGELEVET